MRRLLWVAMISTVLGFSLPAMAQPEILLYQDANYQNLAQAALDDLSLSYTIGNSSTFNALLSGGAWDLVVVDCPSNTPSSWTPLVDYIDGGGKTVMSFWNLNGESALAAAFDVSVTSSHTAPENVYAWATSHAIFTTPFTIGDLTAWNDYWWDDGDHLTALNGAQELAGFTTSPAAGQAGIVLGNGGLTIYNGFLFDEIGNAAGVNLIANEISYLLDAGSAIPAPGALLLGGIGVGLAGWLRRRRAL